MDVKVLSSRTSQIISLKKYILTLAFLAFLGTPVAAFSYIGPGAGFAFAGSFFLTFFALLAAIIVLLLWPVRFFLFYLKRKKGFKKTEVNRVVILGLDGLDPSLIKKYVDEGRINNIAGIIKEGTFLPLQTTCPSISPVAWSSFATSLTPAKHGIFDFLGRDISCYKPVLSSVKITGVKKRLRFGKYLIPLKKAGVRLLRKGVPFWHFLAEKGISCSIIRVPITFPPEKFEGRLLSAMCVPDLAGTQGTFSYYSAAPSKGGREGGNLYSLKVRNRLINTFLEGPSNIFVSGEPRSKLPLRINIHPDNKEAEFILPSIKFSLKEGQYSEWIKVDFKLAPFIKARGICRFLITSFEPFSFYVTPVNIDPESPHLPISHPKIFSVYYHNLIGGYATLGLAEDTWALNEQVISETQFLDQCYSIHEEREAMLLNEIENVKSGLIVCVFDITDRVQHMFWRYQDKNHPAFKKADCTAAAEAIPDMYSKMDDMVGRIKGKLDPKDVLIIMSDHGFTSFRRGVNLNTWLYENGYLSLREGKEPSDEEWFVDVDWGKTKAYALGLGGIYLNLKGREARGIVDPGREAESLKEELRNNLLALRDERGNKKPILEIYNLRKKFNGPYLADGPELIVGFNEGYRVSWEGAKGIVDGILFKDNQKAWSGDHCVDFSLVPGVFVSSLKMNTNTADIMDIGPTVLDLFGVQVPPRMEGRVLS